MTTYTNKKGQIVGFTDGDTYITTREPTHFMIKYKGFGISEDILIDLTKRDIKWVVIRYKGKQGDKTYKVSLFAFIDSVKRHNFGGDDEQMFVSIDDMGEESRRER